MAEFFGELQPFSPIGSAAYEHAVVVKTNPNGPQQQGRSHQIKSGQAWLGVSFWLREWVPRCNSRCSYKLALRHLWVSFNKGRVYFPDRTGPVGELLNGKIN